MGDASQPESHLGARRRQQDYLQFICLAASHPIRPRARKRPLPELPCRPVLLLIPLLWEAGLTQLLLQAWVPPQYICEAPSDLWNPTPRSQMEDDPPPPHTHTHRDFSKIPIMEGLVSASGSPNTAPGSLLDLSTHLALQEQSLPLGALNMHRER